MAVTARRFAIWAQLTANPLVTIEALAGSIGCSHTTVWQDLVALEEMGYIRRRSCGQTGVQVLVRAAIVQIPVRTP